MKHANFQTQNKSFLVTYIADHFLHTELIKEMDHQNSTSGMYIIKF